MLEKGKISFEDANRFLSDSDVTHDTLYFKPADSRQGIELPGGYSTDITDEYRSMQRLYDVAPDLAVEPVELVDDPAGYFMEYVEGRNLETVLREDISDYDVDYVLQQAGSLGEKIKESGVPHGDIRASNFILTSESELMAIDPAGIPEDIDSQRVISIDQQAVNWDITDLNEYIIDRLIDESGFNENSEEYHIPHNAIEM